MSIADAIETLKDAFAQGITGREEAFNTLVSQALDDLRDAIEDATS